MSITESQVINKVLTDKDYSIINRVRKLPAFRYGDISTLSR